MSQSVIEGFRLSPQQKDLWLAARQGAAAVAQCAVTVTGALDPARFEVALHRVVARHESLRTRFESLPGMAVPVQVVDETARTELVHADLSGLGDGASQDALEALQRRERGRPFDPDRGPLARFLLATLGPEDHLLIATAHALCADASSLKNAAVELVRAYAGDEPEEEPLQYVQYSEWLNAVLEEPDEEEREGLAFWDRQERDGGPEWSLPLERRDAPSGRFPDLVAMPLGAELEHRMDEVADALGGSARSFLLACWSLLLLRLSGRGRGSVEVRFDGRKFEELASAIGLFAKDIPLAVEWVAERTFATELRRVERRLDELAEFEEFFVRSGTNGSDPAPPAVGFAFDGERAGFRGERLSAAVARAACHLPSTKLRLAVTGGPEGVVLELFYDPGRYDAAEARRLLDRLRTLVAGAAERPEATVGSLPIVAPSELPLLEEWCSRPAPPPPNDDLRGRFAAWARERPEQPALIADGLEIPAERLLERVHRLAARLRGLGIGPEARVALCLGRSGRWIEALLAVLEAGGAWVPVDPLQPPERFIGMLRDGGAAAVVTESVFRGRIPDDLPGIVVLDDPAEAATLDELPTEAPGDLGSRPRDLAYLLFTSGSTGRPKGVAVERASVSNLIEVLEREIYRKLEDGSPLRVSLNAPLTFDASVKQWTQILRGHTLVIVPEEVRADGEALSAWIQEHRIDVFDCTPSQLRVLLQAGLEDADAAPLHPRAVLVGGEAIDGEMWRRLASGARTYFNLYGPTECTGDTTCERVAGEGPPSIGVPLGNVVARVADPTLEWVPIGAEGELVVGGAGLARGYAGRPRLTAGSFVPDPFGASPGERLYRTGDRVRHLADGRLEFLGRLDHQVKVRGTRIELGEIEEILGRHPEVGGAVVELREDATGAGRLVAYVVPPRERSARDGEVRVPRTLRPVNGAAGLDAELFTLPNGLRIHHQNRNESEFIYGQIFEDEVYLTHGVELDDGAVVFDVGANVGLFPLYLHQLYDDLEIHACEPIPANLERLRANVERYGLDVTVHPVGLSNRPGRAEFTFYPLWSAASGLYADESADERAARLFLVNRDEALDEYADEILEDRFRGETVSARLETLSRLIDEHGVERIDLLKLDVEKAELDILEGIEDRHWPAIRQLVIEVHDLEGRLEVIRRLLEDRGFSVLVNQDRLAEGTGIYNLYATRRPLSEMEAGRTEPRDETETGGPSSSDLREYLRERLPEYMLPADFVVLGDFPYNRNGKIDRSALPAPEDVQSSRDREVASPRTPVEEMLVGVFGEVLGLDRVGRDENFFDLGGHSLVATQVMSRVRTAFQVELPLRLLFERPSASGLGSRIEAALRGGEGRVAPLLEPVERVGEPPLSFAQQRLWFLHRLDPGGWDYNGPKAIRVRGPLDLSIIGATLDEVVRRHEVLRTVFPEVDGEPVQRIEPPRSMPLPTIDLSSLPEEHRYAEAQRQGARLSRQPFDLTREAAVRVRAFRLGSEDHVVLFVLHHIAGDAWSLAVLDQEVRSIYGALVRGEKPSLPELPIQYADYAAWQRDWLRGEALEHHLSYWRRQLAGAPPTQPVPSEETMGPGPDAGEPENVTRTELGVADALRALSRRQGATLYMTLLAAFFVLMQRSLGRDDLVVGTGTAGRDRSEIEGLIGFFINMLPLRVDLSDRPTFPELVSRVREVALGAYAHQELPFEKLVEELKVERVPGMNPLFQVHFGLQTAPSSALELPGVELSNVNLGLANSRFDLSIWMEEEEDALYGVWTFDPERVRPPVVARLQRRFSVLLGSIADDPERRIDELEALDEEERELQGEQARAAKSSARQKFVKTRSRAGTGEARREGETE